MGLVKAFDNFYNGKRIFITGHTGFKGSWLLLWLHSLGANIRGVSLSPEFEDCIYNFIRGDELCHSVIHNIQDASFIEHEIKIFEPEIIFHLAAQPLVRRGYRYPNLTFETNVNGTLNILEAVRKSAKPCVVVVITTDKVYQNIGLKKLYIESDKLEGYDPYSASKSAAEMIVSSYRNSFFHPDCFNSHQISVATARAGNVIGGGDYSEDRIVPDLIKAVKADQVLKIRNPSSVRPWQFVLEPLFGYLALASKMERNPVKYSTSYNFGPEKDDVLTVEELVRIAINQLGRGRYEIENYNSQFHEAHYLQLDNSKAKSDLNVFPVYDSREAIEKTVEWYSNAYHDYRQFSLNQIEEYVRRIL